ncbi:hypothetical protein FQZ97_1008960 [compost metagenome]
MVVVAAVVDVVVEAGGADEQAIVLTPVEVRFGEDAEAVVDQAALVEGVVAVVGGGACRVGETIGQRVIAIRGAPGDGVGDGGIPVDLEVIVDLVGLGLDLTAQGKGQRGNLQGKGQRLEGGSCSCHLVLCAGRCIGPTSVFFVGGRLAGLTMWSRGDGNIVQKD